MGHVRNRPRRLAAKLLQIRKALGLTQREMAKQLRRKVREKLTDKHVSKYERRKSQPSLRVLLAYSELANVLINQIVDDRVNLKL